MSANSFGEIFKMTSFGESHGVALGVVIEGCPAGVNFNENLLKANMAKRKPNQSAITTSRNEDDVPQVLSGIFEGKTLGTPICIIVKNQDQKSEDYQQIKDNPRVGHADDVWVSKFGHADHRGGGRSSGRETLCRVLAGSVAEMLCCQLVPHIQIKAFSKQIGDLELSQEEIKNIWNIDVNQFESKMPSAEKNQQIVNLLLKAKAEGQSYGGVVQVLVKDAPQGLGQPVFNKLKADLAKAMLSIGATNSFELGQSDHNNLKGTEFHHAMDSINYGGIRGGISTGDMISFQVGFKPTSSVMDVAKKGRHDPCILPRAIPVIEAMTWMILADHLLWSRLDKI